MISVSHIEVIINAGSGVEDSTANCQQITDFFDAHGIKANVHLASSGDELLEIARRAAQSDAQIIVAGGGDGTISTVASLLVGTNKMLGVLPLGTLNHFAKDLRIPLDLEEAIRTLAHGYSIKIDVGMVNDRVFINNSSLGLYPEIVRHREKHQRRGLSKWTAFFYATLTVLRRFPLLSVRLLVEGQEFTHRTPFVFVGNNEYKMNLFEMGTRASLTDGQLSLYFAPLTRRWHLFRFTLRAILGRLADEADFTALPASEVWVDTRHRRRLRVATDGEITLMDAPLHYVVRPGALRVIVPMVEESEKQGSSL